MATGIQTLPNGALIESSPLNDNFSFLNTKLLDISLNTNDYATIYDAVSAANTSITNKILLFSPGNHSLTGNLSCDDITLWFVNGATISGSGTISANGTMINAGLHQIFDVNLSFSGSFTVPEAYPEWFGAVGGTADDTVQIQKTIDIFPRTKLTQDLYSVSNYGASEYQCIYMRSNRTLEGNKNTELKILTSSDTGYKILHCHIEDNIKIQTLKITGDRYTHGATGGEWGYGICVKGASNVTIEDIYIKEMWGDGIDIDASGNSQAERSMNVIIRDVTCDDNRRQGLSVEGIKGLYIYDSKFINTNGTAPQYGIDFETYRVVPVNEDIYLNNVECSGNSSGQLLNVTPVDGFKAEKCKLIGEDTNTALFWNNLGADEANDVHQFINCDLIGSNLLYKVSEYNNCNFKSTDITLEMFLVNDILDAKKKFIGCTFYCDTLTKFINIAGSTTEETTKSFIDCTFEYDGNGSSFGSFRNLTGLAGYFNFNSCKFHHTGAAFTQPITVGGALSILNGTTGIMKNCYIDNDFHYAPINISGFVNEFVDKKIGTYSHNTATANGTFSVSGLGFKPRTIIFFAGIQGTQAFSLGFAEIIGGTLGQGNINYLSVFSATFNLDQTNSFIIFTGGGPDYVTFTLSSMDIDGFTMTFAQTGGPTGTCIIKYMAFR